MGSWKDNHPKVLKKIVFSMTEHTLNNLIVTHQDRGWMVASEIKKHGYGLGCLMIFKKTERNEENAKTNY